MPRKISGKYSDSNFSKKDIITNYNYQNITGIPLTNNKFSYEIKSRSKFPFIVITNLKLNNKFVISYGNEYINIVTKELEKILEKTFTKKTDYKYEIINSFSWFELTLVLYLNDFDHLANLIHEIRNLKFSPTCNSLDIKKINAIFKNENDFDYKTSHLISETVSYIGIEKEYFDNQSKEKEIAITKNFSKINFKTTTEWHVKPGHLENFIQLLHKFNTENNIEHFKISGNTHPQMVFGKTDFEIQEHNTDKLSSNILTHKFILENQVELFKHIKGISTKVYLDTKIEKNDNFENYNDSKLSTNVKQGFCSTIFEDGDFIDFDDIDLHLKKIAISRHLREMIIKVLQLFQSGITDNVLSVYFLDCKLFVENFVENISNKHKKQNIKDDTIENYLYEYITTLDESIKLRMLNSYQYSDITELNLDFNSSLQQVLTTYNSIANYYANHYFGGENIGLLVTISHKSTKANPTSIRYNSYDLLYPEFVVFTLSKEILNFSDNFSNIILTTFTNIENKLEKILTNNNHYYENTFFLFKDKIVEVRKHLFPDALRLALTCNFDFSLFVYWTFATVIKDSECYDDYKRLKREIFQSTLYRLLFLRELYGIKYNLYCPAKNLEPLWNEYYITMEKEIKNIFHNRYNNEFFKLVVYPLKELIVHYLNIYLNNDEINTKNYDSIYDFISESKFIENSELYKVELIIKNINKQSTTLAELNNTVYNYLSQIKNKNYPVEGAYINCLKRDFLHGNPIPLKNNDTTSIENEAYYAIDYHGIAYFDTKQNTDEYFKVRNDFLRKLWALGQQCKCELYLNNKNGDKRKD